MEKILVLSNMYPNSDNPAYGVFVKNFVEQIEKIEVPYDKIVMHSSKNKISKVLNYLLFFIQSIYKMLFMNYKAIYVHYPSITGIPVILVSFFKKLTIYTNVHGTDVLPVSQLEKMLVKNTTKILKCSEKVIVPSNYYKEIIIDQFNVERGNIYIYPSGGIDSNVFYPLNPIKKDSDKLILGFVGRLVKTKGWDVFVDALKKLQEEGLDKRIKVIIIGEGEDSEELSKKVNELKPIIEIEIHPFARQDKLNHYYNEFDALIFPTYKESLGLVALEAMSTGTPVIGSEIPPLTDYINHFENGLLFEKGSSIDLKEKLIDFIHLSDEKQKDMKNQALQKSKDYSVQSALKTLKQIFY